MPFGSKTSRGIGTSPVGVGSNATPAAGKTWVVIGLTLCNVKNPAAALTVTVALLDAAANTTNIIKDFPLPAGETVVPQGMLGKVVMAPGDTIVVTSSTATGVDAILSYLES